MEGKKQMKFTITPDGIKVEASGYTGGKCLTDLKDFEKHMRSIGVTCNEKSQEKKSEVYVTDSTIETTQNHY